MCGGGVVKDLFTPVTDLGLVAAAPFTGGASLEALPLVNAAETKAQGGSWGQAALSGGEALAGQELAESFGLGPGNTAVNSALGLDLSPAATGLPDIGNSISQLFGSSGATGTPTEGTPTPGGGTIASVGSQGSATSTGAPIGAAPSAPASVGGASDLTSLDSSGLSGSNFQNYVGANAPSDSAALGTPTAGTSSGGNAGTFFGSNTSTPANNFLNANAVTTSGLDSSFGTGSAAGGAGSTGGLNGLLKQATNYISKNPSVAVSALGLGADALKGNQLAKGERQLQQQAGQMSAQGNQLQKYLDSGTLPPGVQQSINQAAAARKAQITSQYASMGMTGSSSMQQELAAVDSWAQGEGASVAMNLLNQGINESGLASQLYSDMATRSIQQDANLGTALANFASSFGGSGAKA